MRSVIVLAATAAALTALSGRSAHAQGWCSYAAHPKSLIQCGYSSNTECQNAIGKDGTCFPDPEFALNERRASPVVAGGKPSVGKARPRVCQFAVLS